MKSVTLLGLGLIWLPYQAFFPGLAGNPDDQPYIGQPGGVYDRAANPPHTDGVVAYDPNAPLPQPAGQTTPGGSVAPPAMPTTPAR